MVSADKGNDDDTRLVVRVVPRVTGAILNDRVTRPKFALCAVIELKNAAAGNDELVVDRRSRVHSGMIWLSVLT
jgi:hypothetical protein